MRFWPKISISPCTKNLSRSTRSTISPAVHAKTRFAVPRYQFIDASVFTGIESFDPV